MASIPSRRLTWFSTSESCRELCVQGLGSINSQFNVHVGEMPSWWPGFANFVPYG